MIETFWRWKQVLTIRKWCLEREKKKEKKGRENWKFAVGYGRVVDA
jgi:hypothetical protein